MKQKSLIEMEGNPDIDYIKSIIPMHYRVKESKAKGGSIHCVSTGTNKGMTEPEWHSFKSQCFDHFEDNILEFYHHVNHDHQDFTIFLR